MHGRVYASLERKPVLKNNLSQIERYATIISMCLCIPWRLHRYIFMNWKAFFVKWENFDKLQLIESSTTYYYIGMMHIPNRMRGPHNQQIKGKFWRRETYDKSWLWRFFYTSIIAFFSIHHPFSGGLLETFSLYTLHQFLIVQSWDTNKTLNIATTILERFFQKSG